MADNGEALDAYINFHAENGELKSTINTALGDIQKLTPAATTAEKSVQSIFKQSGGGLQSGIKSVTSDLKEANTHAGHATGGLHGFFKALRSEGGKKSVLGESLELLRGAGSIMAVSLLGEVLNKASEKAKELANN